MENTIEKLIRSTYSENENTVLKSIGYIGLLAERHLQIRYSEEDYFHLLDKNSELHKLELNEADIDLIIQTVFYHLVNSNSQAVSFAWCLGKFHQKDLLLGFIRLFEIYKDKADVFIQLLMSLNSVYDFRVMLFAMN